MSERSHSEYPYCEHGQPCDACQACCYQRALWAVKNILLTYRCGRHLKLRRYIIEVLEKK